MSLYINNNLNEVIKSVKENGIFSIKNFLKEEEIRLLQEIVLKNSYTKYDNKKNTYLTNWKDYLKNFYKFKQIHNSFLLGKIAQKYFFKKISSKILESSVNLKTIDAYVSKISNKPVIDWHVDQAYSGKIDVKNFVDPDFASLKFFIYLTDVQRNNGCLGYIPKSHKICYYLKKGIWEKKIQYSPYWKLIDLRNKIMEKNVYNYLISKLDFNLIDEFIENTKFIKNVGDEKKFDIELDKGGLIIFDESGVHRGSSPSKNDRAVCRFHFKRLN